MTHTCTVNYYLVTIYKVVISHMVVSTKKHGCYHANSKVVSTKLVFFVWDGFDNLITTMLQYCKNLVDDIHIHEADWLGNIISCIEIPLYKYMYIYSYIHLVAI